jgi:Aspartyl protease
MTRPPRLCALLALMGPLALMTPLAMVAVPAGVARADCRVEPLGTVSLELAGGLVLLTATVNDTDAVFIMDTGAERTLMSEEAVHRLGLERDGWVTSTMRGLSGYEERPNALPRSLRLGGIALRRKTLTGDTSATVGPLPVNRIDGHPIAGLLGRDFLSPFDLDLDIPARSLTLNDVHGCSAGFLPWTTPYVAIPATTPVGNAMVIQTEVDGRALRTMVDTGASASLLTASGMFRLGLTAEVLEHDPGGNGSGVGPAPVPMRLHRFAELRIGPDVTRNQQLWVASSAHVVPIVDMLLGIDWLRSRRVWLSYATRQFFVAVRR